MPGLPWIKVATDLPTHPKAILLAIHLQCPRAWTHVIQLWFWTAQHKGDGQITGPGCQDVIEHAAGWGGDRGAFVDAAVRVGFLDEVSNGYAIHDWQEYAGAHIARKHRDADRKRTERGRPKDVRGTSDGHRRESSGHPDMSGCERERERETETTTKKTGGELVPLVAVEVFPCVGKGPQEYRVSEAQAQSWGAAYPGIDLLSELRKARAWLEANPTRRKTHRGIPAFVVGWLNRAQDKPRPADAPAKRLAFAPAEPHSAFPVTGEVPL